MFPESDSSADIDGTADEPVTHLTPHEARAILAGEVARILVALAALTEALLAKQPADYETPLYVPATGPGPVPVEVPLSYENRRHLLVWVPVAVTGVSINVPGIGAQGTITLAAGWTVLDPPRDARISATAAFYCKVRCTDNVPPGLY